MHLHAGLNAGLRPSEVTEAIMQALPYAGFPRIVNAMTVARQVFAERREPSPGA